MENRRISMRNLTLSLIISLRHTQIYILQNLTEIHLYYLLLEHSWKWKSKGDVGAYHWVFLSLLKCWKLCDMRFYPALCMKPIHHILKRLFKEWNFVHDFYQIMQKIFCSAGGAQIKCVWKLFQALDISVTGHLLLITDLNTTEGFWHM